MTAIIVKIFGIVVFGILGRGLWRQGNKWKANGEIPKEWVEAKVPKPVLRGESGFYAAIAWQKAMGVLVWFFAALLALSIVLQLMGIL
jgi:hypothetical protein